MLSVTAAPISEKEAFRAAELFCKRKGLRGNLELSSLKRKGCYLFNIDDKGYVIVASDDNANPILGYSMNGALREDLNLAPGFVDWMDDIERKDTILKLFPQNVKNRAKYSVRSASDTFTSDFLVVVKPLITTRWDQGAPANLFVRIVHWQVALQSQWLKLCTITIVLVIQQLRYRLIQLQKSGIK